MESGASLDRGLRLCMRSGYSVEEVNPFRLIGAGCAVHSYRGCDEASGVHWADRRPVGVAGYPIAPPRRNRQQGMDRDWTVEPVPVLRSWAARVALCREL
jgi:hypothetical protein